MHLIDVIRQLLIYVHILAFALATAEVLREDWRMLRATVLDLQELAAAASRVKWLLAVLWATGVPLLGFVVGWDFAAIAAMPKLAMKVLVVIVLTLNGALLHLVAFPLLNAHLRSPRFVAAAASVLGAVSSASWLYASFVGAARLIAPQMTFVMFLGLYLTMLVCAILVAALLMRPRLERLIAARNQNTPHGDQHPMFHEVEKALSAVGRAQDHLLRLRNVALLEAKKLGVNGGD